MGFFSKNTGVSCHFLLQGIFPTQGLTLHLLHWGWILYTWNTGEAHCWYNSLEKFQTHCYNFLFTSVVLQEEFYLWYWGSQLLNLLNVHLLISISYYVKIFFILFQADMVGWEKVICAWIFVVYFFQDSNVLTGIYLLSPVEACLVSFFFFNLFILIGG